METLTKPKAGSRRTIHRDETPKEVSGSTNGADAETVLVFLGKIEAEEAKVAAAKKRLNKTWKLAINAGIVRKDLDLVRKLADQDPDTVLSTLSRIKQYAAFMQVPIGAQLSLLDIPQSSILSSSELGERAHRAGYVLGITGKNPDEQAYPTDNEHHQRHLEGWHDGQKVLLDRIGTIDLSLDSDGKDGGEITEQAA